MINPILLAGADALDKYQKQRIEEWTKHKGKNEPDFDHYFANIMKEWAMDDQHETSINSNAFESDDIDTDLSKQIQEKLKAIGILNDNGYINFKTISDEKIITALDQFEQLSDEQRTHIKETIAAIHDNQPSDFDTYSKGVFAFNGQTPALEKYNISQETSHAIWAQLNEKNIIDDYGVLLFDPKSEELTSEIYRLTGVNEFQKERVLILLNQHPELSYHRYLERFNSASSDPNRLPKVGIYFADGVEMLRHEGLSKKELDYIKILAILEWNVLIVSQKSAHKSREKLIKKAKQQKKDDEKKDLEHLAKLEAQYKKDRKQKKSSKAKGS